MQEFEKLADETSTSIISAHISYPSNIVVAGYQSTVFHRFQNVFSHLLLRLSDLDFEPSSLSKAAFRLVMETPVAVNRSSSGTAECTQSEIKDFLINIGEMSGSIFKKYYESIDSNVLNASIVVLTRWNTLKISSIKCTPVSRRWPWSKPSIRVEYFVFEGSFSEDSYEEFNQYLENL